MFCLERECTSLQFEVCRRFEGVRRGGHGGDVCVRDADEAKRQVPDDGHRVHHAQRHGLRRQDPPLHLQDNGQIGGQKHHVCGQAGRQQSPRVRFAVSTFLKNCRK